MLQQQGSVTHIELIVRALAPATGKHGSLVLKELIAHALDTATGKHGSVLCMELIMHAHHLAPLCTVTNAQH